MLAINSTRMFDWNAIKQMRQKQIETIRKECKIGSDIDGVVIRHEVDRKDYRPHRMHEFYRKGLKNDFIDGKQIDVLITGRKYCYRRATAESLNKEGISCKYIIHFPTGKENKKTNKVLCEYKKDVINRLQLEIYYEDDIRIYNYLVQHCPKTKIIKVDASHNLTSAKIEDKTSNRNSTLFEYQGFKIDEEINGLFSNLPEWEYTELKKDIQRDGIRNPLVITKDKLAICGHQRLRIAKDLQLSKEQIPFIIKNFDNRKQLVEFAVNDNILRRQLNDFQKGFVSLKLLPYYEKSAKIRQKAGTSVKDLTKGGRALEKCAEKVGISFVTLHKIRYIIDNADETEIKELSYGTLSISKAHEKLKAIEKIMENKEVIVVDLNDLEFNELNPNVMNEKTMNILKKSIEIYGFVKPILTTKRNGKYFVIDGEKRAKAMNELGKEKILTLVINNCSEAKAHLGSIRFNRGKPLTNNQIRNSQLYKELCKTYSEEELKKYLPFLDSIS